MMSRPQLAHGGVAVEKISRILASSPRVTTSDNQGSGVARPGSPAMGRAVGASTGTNKVPFDGASSAIAIHNEQADKRTSEKVRSEIVSQLTDSFFMNKNRPVADLEQQPQVSVQGAMAMAKDAPSLPSQAGNADDLDQPAVGRFVDVNV